MSTLRHTVALIFLMALLATAHSNTLAAPRARSYGGVRSQQLLGSDIIPPDKRVEVFLADQRLIAWQGDRKVFELPVTTGQEGEETFTGDYEILDKEEDAYSNAWLLKLPYWMGVYQYGDFENGFHALPTDEDGAELWRDAVGKYPASHGCIVLLPQDAVKLFKWAEIGTQVEVYD
jgi:lipoprotein-anchoring transpeptidase ErfK/SrfK